MSEQAEKLKTKQFSTYLWKPEAGKILFYCVLGFVILNQIIFQGLTIVGVNLPFAPNVLYVVVIAAFVIIHGTITKGWKRAVIGFVVLFIVGFVMEGLGVNYGLIYGPYHYELLDSLRVWGVPWYVPVSWELNMYPAFYLAMFLFPTELISKTTKLWQKGLFVLLISTIGAIFCTMYDLLADPIYCGVTNAWVWHFPGDFAPTVHGGIPLSNFLGWILTGIVGCAIYYVILESTPPERHVKSNYLGFWFPITVYIGAMIMPILLNTLLVKDESITMSIIFGMGSVILMVASKFIFTKFGYTYVKSPETLELERSL